MATRVVVTTDDPEGRESDETFTDEWRFIADGRVHACIVETHRNGTVVLTIKPTTAEECGEHE